MTAGLPVALDAPRPLPAAVPAAVSSGGPRGRPREVSGSRGLRLVLFGVSWGIVLTGIEMASSPFNATASRPLWLLLLYQSVRWSVGGLMLAFALWWSTRGEVRWFRLALLLPVVAVASAVGMIVTGRLGSRIFGFSAGDPVLGQAASPDSLLLYIGWLTLIYGGCAGVIYALRRRIDQTTDALRGLTLARERNEAAIAEARVSAMVERIEPRFLLDAMDAARRQYAGQPEAAEATLNACTAFLRTAMPQVRSRRSTVAAELDLVASYLTLRDCMASHAPRWRIERRSASALPAEAVDLERVPLPPMVLLPIVERLCERNPDGSGAIAIEVRIDAAAIDIRIEAGAGDAASIAPYPDWLGALSSRIVQVCGTDASIQCADAKSAVLIVVPHRIDHEQAFRKDI